MRSPASLLLLCAPLVFGAALGACSSSVDVHTARSPGAHFEQYRTFSFESDPRSPIRYARSPQSAYVESRIEQVATSILEAKGYVPAQGPADLHILVSAGRLERELQLPQRARPDWLLEDEEDDFVEGAFVIDAFDGSRGDMLWHGAARLEVDPRRVDEDRLTRAVHMVLEGFPAR
ncbi:MAG TPA: DUF4136 domain-containing protein [Polyangiaceae bacterium]|jgi:hypothetical protein